MSLPDFGKATSTHLQLASAGKWENAVQPDDLTEDNLDAWLSTTASDVAIEAVFKINWKASGLCWLSQDFGGNGGTKGILEELDGAVPSSIEARYLCVY